MRKILIIKTGTTFPDLAAQRGDFDDWIICGMQIDRQQVRVVETFNSDDLPAYENIHGIVITGSHDMVTAHLDYHERTAKWLPEAIARKIPILGICFGHQLLAYAMGGKIDNNPNGSEFGTVLLKLNKNAISDNLFRNFPSSFPVHVTHTQSVIELPPGATLLASSAMEPHQAYKIGDRTWGVQFHPEFDAAITIEYIDHLQHLLKNHGKLISNCEDNKFGLMLLKHFTRLIS